MCSRISCLCKDLHTWSSLDGLHTTQWYLCWTIDYCYVRLIIYGWTTCTCMVKLEPSWWEALIKSPSLVMLLHKLDCMARHLSRPHCPISKHSWIYEHAVRLPGSLSSDMVQLVRAGLSFVLRVAALRMRNEWTVEPRTFEPLAPVSDWNRNKLVIRESLGTRLFRRKSYDRNGHT